MGLIHALIVAGTMLLALSLVSFLTALNEKRRPRVALLAILVALGLLAYAFWLSPVPLDFWSIPEAFYQTIANAMKILRL